MGIARRSEDLMDDFDAIREFATTRQCEVLDAIEKAGSKCGAARALGVYPSYISKTLKNVRARAAMHGVAPRANMNRVAPEPFIVKGTSTLYDADGKAKLQWVKTRVDQDKMEAAIRATIEALKEEIPHEAPAPLAVGRFDANLMNCYVITDYHLGALSWGEETGADWDLKIAEDTLVAWFSRAIEQSPAAETALLAQISDFLHWDGFDPVTPAHRNLLDADTRFPKLVRVAIRVLRRVIRMLLAKHPKVHIIMADANHDPASQVWLREWLSVLYEDDERVTVDTSPSPYNVFEFGKVAIFTHHGHKRKVTNVAEVLAAKFREIYGRTKYAYAHMGHLHSVDVKENNLMIVEQHRTLAAPDAYAARGGWISGRDAKVITYHKDFGEVGRITVSYDMVAKTEGFS